MNEEKSSEDDHLYFVILIFTFILIFILALSYAVYLHSLDSCELSEEERKIGINISELIEN